MADDARGQAPAPAASGAVLMYAAPEASADLFHAVPARIGDPFLYAETDGRRVAAVSALDADTVRALGVEVIDPAALGQDELIAAGFERSLLSAEVALRGCRELGIATAVVPPDFPLLVADHLRAGGVELAPDGDAFAARRRVKSTHELEGIRRAQEAADAAMAVAAELIHALPRGLTAERVRAEMRAACDERGCALPADVIVSHGPQSALGHEAGHGRIERGEPVVVDIWPRDAQSRCWADMTRTFLAGGGRASGELLELWKLCCASLEAVYREIRAGVHGTELFGLSCEPFEAAGRPTQRTKREGEALADGYFHSLGHGVGLEVHERPYMGRTGDVLLAGDVVSIEPGCYRRGFGGCRLEDLVVVTDAGCEVLTDFPYDL